MDAILATIVGVGLTGITVFAYRHPKGYQIVGIGLAMVSLLVLGAALIWDLGNDAAHRVAMEYIPHEKMDDAIKAIQDTTFRHTTPYLAAWVIGLVGYLVFLLWLPLLLSVEKSVKEDMDK